MKRLFFISLLILVSGLITSAQNNTPCPKISVIGASSTIEPGDEIPFSVFLSDEAKNLNLEYKWRVSKGEIIEGQGTTSIKVVSVRLTAQVITATVEIKGLPEKCPKEFSETSAQYVNFIRQEYEAESFSDESTNLDQLINVLNNDKGIVATFYLDFTNPTDNQVNSRIQRVLNYLASRKVSLKDQITFIAIKSEQDFNRIFYQFKDDEPLICTNCQIIKIIKGVDFDMETHNSVKGKKT